MNYFVYILLCSDSSYYTGWTTDPERRLKQHNNGTASRYTRIRRPVHLVHLEQHPDRSSAMKREAAIKNKGRQAKERIVIKGHEPKK